MTTTEECFTGREPMGAQGSMDSEDMEVDPLIKVEDEECDLKTEDEEECGMKSDDEEVECYIKSEEDQIVESEEERGSHAVTKGKEGERFAASLDNELEPCTDSVDNDEVCIVKSEAGVSERPSRSQNEKKRSAVLRNEDRGSDTELEEEDRESIIKSEEECLTESEDEEEFVGFPLTEIKECEKLSELKIKKNELLTTRLANDATGVVVEEADSLPSSFSKVSDKYGREELGQSPLAGPGVALKDSQVESSGSDAERALHSLPDGLVMRPSKIPGAGDGVWTERGLEEGLRFGPYEGISVIDSQAAHQSGYCWRIYTVLDMNITTHYVDAQYHRFANWLRFVNCARNEQEQNLLAYQYQGNIYYKTIKPVAKGSELLVWYGDESLKIPSTPEAKSEMLELYQKAGFKVWECELCKRSFPSEDWLRHHGRYHGEERDSTTLKCGQCLYTTNYSRDIAAHIGMHNGNGIFSSENSCKRFKVVNDLDKQKNAHYDGESKLSVCMESNTGPVNHHQYIDTVQRNHTCALCNYCSTDMRDRIDHMKRHPGEILYSCTHCEFKTRDAIVFKIHKKVHSELDFEKDTVFNLGQAGYMEVHVKKKWEVEASQFPESREQVDHMRTHGEVKPISCANSQYKVREQTVLEIDMKKKELVNNESLGLDNMKDQMKSHARDELETCKICGYKAAKVEDLKTHMWKHRAKPYACSDCGCRAGSARQLKEHMLTHSREKLFNNFESGYNMALARNMRIHMDKQMGMNHYCTIKNDKMATQVGEQKEHITVQTVEKPNICQVSKVRNAQTGNHVSTNSTERPFCCSGYVFRSAFPDELEAHVRTHMKEELKTSKVSNHSTAPSGCYMSLTDELKDPLRKHIGEDSKGTLLFEYKNALVEDSPISMRKPKAEKSVCSSTGTDKTALADKVKDHCINRHKEEEPYSCVCDYKTAHLSELLVHMGTHIGENPFCCTVCSYRTALADDIRNHIKIHLGKEPKSSPVSENRTRQGRDPCVQMIQENDRPYCCSMCTYRTAISDELKGHMRTHTMSKDVALTVPSDRPTGAVYHQVNISRKPGEKPFSCPVCGFMTATFPRLREHMQVHLYGYGLDKAEDLRIRGRMPAKIKSYICTECDYKAAQAGQLKDHMKTHTGEKPFKCKECDFSTIRAGDLKVHMRKHTGEKPYSCTECGYSTTRAGHLSVHMRTHTGEKPYSCKICGYRFAQTSQLKTHMRNHTGEKPYSCTFCDCKFTQAGHLNFHMRTHTGEKPFCCSKCGYRAAQAGHLKEHMRTHTGEKPYSCDVCDYRTARSRDLVAHMRTHTGEKPFSCPKCDYKAATAGQIKKHNVRAHAGDKH